MNKIGTQWGVIVTSRFNLSRPSWVWDWDAVVDSCAWMRCMRARGGERRRRTHNHPSDRPWHEGPRRSSAKRSSRQRWDRWAPEKREKNAGLKSISFFISNIHAATSEHSLLHAIPTIKFLLTILCAWIVNQSINHGFNLRTFQVWINKNSISIQFFNFIFSSKKNIYLQAISQQKHSKQAKLYAQY